VNAVSAVNPEFTLGAINVPLLRSYDAIERTLPGLTGDTITWGLSRGSSGFAPGQALRSHDQS
jgi:hypothetical protein